MFGTFQTDWFASLQNVSTLLVQVYAYLCIDGERHNSLSKGKYPELEPEETGEEERDEQKKPAGLVFRDAMVPQK